MIDWLGGPGALGVWLGGLLLLAWLRRAALKKQRPDRTGPAISSSARAVVHCVNNRAVKTETALYEGPLSCRVMHLYDLGVSACPQACWGYGDCRSACPTGALTVVNRTAVVRADLCRGCGLCCRACPQQLIKLTPANARAIIPCLARAKMKAVADICSVGCLGCLQCLKACPAHAISRALTGPPVIDHERCRAYGPGCELACRHKCPRGIMRPGPCINYGDGGVKRLPVAKQKM